ncbi:spectrin binding protein [Aureococcus anophagefferens]|uniref:Spectrin binding protein n=1 Tax=Aureococcus anophagefferens TaxID=44056 RepID=A0ABR1FXD9_AURAN
MGEQMDCEVSDDGSGGASSHALEVKLNKRLALLEKLKDVDVHTACWGGDVDLVRAHLDFAGRGGGVRARASSASRVVEVLLEAGARVDARNAPGARRSSSRRSRAAAVVVRLLYDRDPATNCASRHELVPTGDGRMLCALGVARARTAASRPRRGADRHARRARRPPPRATPPAPALVPCDDPDAGASAGGLEATWAADAYAPVPGAPRLPRFPVHHVKVKVLRADDVDGDPAARRRARAAAHRARIPAHAAGARASSSPARPTCAASRRRRAARARVLEPSAPATAAEPLAVPARAAAKKRPRIRGDAGTPHGKMAVRTSMDEEENRLADAARYDTPKNLAASRDDATTDGSTPATTPRGLRRRARRRRGSGAAGGDCACRAGARARRATEAAALLGAGAAATATSAGGESALEAATASGELGAALALVKAGASARATDDAPSASRDGFVGDDELAADADGRSALHRAARADCRACVAALADAARRP